MNQPDYPLILISNKKVLNIISTEDQFSDITVVGFNKTTNKKVAFDKNGNKWASHLTSAQVKGNFFEKLLAYILYNPILVINKPRWINSGKYQLQELKEVLTQCVDRKTYATTHVGDVAVMKSAINRATSFQTLYKILNEYASGVKQAKL